MTSSLHRDSGGPGALRKKGFGAVAIAVALLATACGGSSHPAAAASTGIYPGVGQSLAGAP